MARVRRGHLLQRGLGRLRREAQALCTNFTLRLRRPDAGTVAIATLNSDEENASVTAVLLANGLDPCSPPDLPPTRRQTPRSIIFLTPSPEQSHNAVAHAARQLGLHLPTNIRYRELGFWALLRAFRDASTTFSTHVLLPGQDRSGTRTHVHLTHGSGPKPDSTFRGPTTVLASITPHWVESQLCEYQLPPDTSVLRAMPRLRVMQASRGDRSVIARLSLDSQRPLLVWAPTYRSIHRGSELRVSGRPFNNTPPDALLRIERIAEMAVETGWQFVAKVHPHDADSFGGLSCEVMTNESLRAAGVTPYELFGAADLVLSDYSSIATERAALQMPYGLFCPDFDEFAASYRGLRQPLFTSLYGDALLQSEADVAEWLSASTPELG